MGIVYALHILVRVILPLFFGGAIYILFGDRGIRLVQWSMDMKMFENLRTSLENHYLPDWLVFNLPDGLWLFSLIQLVDIIWADNKKNANIWVGLSVFMAMVHEIGQFIGWFKGTFDFLDIFIYALFSIISIYVNKFINP